MWVDLGEREIPEGEANTLAQLVLDTFDLPKRSPRVRAFVVAVLEDDPPARRTADVIDVLVQRLQWVRIPYRVGRHVRLLGWVGCSEADGLSDQDDADPPGLLLVDLEHLADEAVLSV